MLPHSSKVAFLLFAFFTLSWGLWGFYRLYLRICRGRSDAESRKDRLSQRLTTALITTLSQQRTFKDRPVVSLFHSFIFYGFVFYLLVNLIDGIDGFLPLNLDSSNPLFMSYFFLADILSFLVLLGVLALVARRFLLPSRRDFRFNRRTLLHPDVRQGRITRDSILVSAFILFHVGSRAIGSAARIALQGPIHSEPFANLFARTVPLAHAEGLRIFGFWGALGSVLAFLAYFPYSKHIHIFTAPIKYTVARRPPSGVIPPLELNLDDSSDISRQTLGAKRLEDLAWPRILDAYACIQCNRCQDVCPASATGKSLSPAALEINKRMELNSLAGGLGRSGFENGAQSPRPLLQFSLSQEALWACTTCGACMEVCPVQDEQMLDIFDIRRHQVMVEGDFPAQLQTAFRGMERAQNPWGISRAKRMDWAEGLNVPTTTEKPSPDVLYWVGCAASYDPSAQKTARAFVQLLDHAEVDFAVLGKTECCTGDSARRAGNEFLYRQLADENVATLNTVNPKLIVASCPHCMNSIGKEYKQIGANYKVVHHTEYLESLVQSGKLKAAPSTSSITYHDPCYLGRHNGVYDAPRNLLNILSNDLFELPRNRENAFCCGAGGAQFWKEEEEGDQRIADNRFHEVQQTLANSTGEEKVLAVGCPFCKSMLSSTPLRAQSEEIVIKDVAELLLEAVVRTRSRPDATETLHPHASLAYQLSSASPDGDKPQTQLPMLAPTSVLPAKPVAGIAQPSELESTNRLSDPTESADESASPVTKPVLPAIQPAPERKKWQPKQSPVIAIEDKSSPAPKVNENTLPITPERDDASANTAPERSAPPTFQPMGQPASTLSPADQSEDAVQSGTQQSVLEANPIRKKWNPKPPNK